MTVTAFIALILVIAGAGASGTGTPQRPVSGTYRPDTRRASRLSTVAPFRQGHGGTNVYAADYANHFTAADRNDVPLVYVPNTISSTVDVISQKTLKIIGSFPVGGEPQHVTPAWNLKRLYVDSDAGNSLTPIDPRTGRPGAPIPVEDPYNLYFTPDGRYAVVIAERMRRLDFRNPDTMALEHSLSVPNCDGVDHGDFSADDRYLYMSCEFDGQMIEVDLKTLSVIRTLTLPHPGAAPQDVKLAPNGRLLYVADQVSNGVWEIDPSSFKVVGFLATGAGTHGLYPSRDAKLLYVTNRQAGTVSVVSFRTNRIVATWTLPQPASPDMGGVSADGSTLWLSGRYNAVVYVIDTRTGRLRAEIPVGQGPHGLSVWPQPGTYSLGHTGIMR